MSRLLTPAEIEALRAAEPFVPAPSETYHVSVEAGAAEVTAADVEALEPGTVLPLRAAKPGLVEIVANAVVVAYGRLEETNGQLAVRVVQLAPGRAGQGKGRGGIR
jgi:hypothetical protein